MDYCRKCKRIGYIKTCDMCGKCTKCEILRLKIYDDMQLYECNGCIKDYKLK